MTSPGDRAPTWNETPGWRGSCGHRRAVARGAPGPRGRRPGLVLGRRGRRPRARLATTAARRCSTCRAAPHGRAGGRGGAFNYTRAARRTARRARSGRRRGRLGGRGRGGPHADEPGAGRRRGRRRAAPVSRPWRPRRRPGRDPPADARRDRRRGARARAELEAIFTPIFSGYGAPAVATRLADCEASRPHHRRRVPPARLVGRAEGGRRRGGRGGAVGAAGPRRAAGRRGADDAVGRRPRRLVGRARRAATADAARRCRPDDRPRDALHADLHLGHDRAGRRAPSTSTAASRSRARRTSPTSSTSGRGDTLFWFTDLGWMMGPWAISGSLLLGARLVLYEGAPDFPGPDRLWSIVARHRVTHLGLSPTVIRALMAHGEEPVRAHDRSSLRVLGSTGEPWNPEPWWWYFRGRRRGPLPDRQLLRRDRGRRAGSSAATCSGRSSPASFSGPCIGTAADVVGRAGRPVRGAVGELVIRAPMPGMTRGLLARRRGALRGHLLVAVPRHLGPRRLGDDRRRRLLVHPRAVRRHAQDRRQAGRAGGGRERRAWRTRPSLEAAAIGVPHEIKGEVVVRLCVLGRASGRSGAPGRDRAATWPRQLGKPLRPDGRRGHPGPAQDALRQGHASRRPGGLARPRSGRPVEPRRPARRSSDPGDRGGAVGGRSRHRWRILGRWTRRRSSPRHRQLGRPRSADRRPGGPARDRTSST